MGMIYLTTCARLLAQAHGGDAAVWLDLLNQAVAARELAVPREGSGVSVLPGGVSFIPCRGQARTPVAGFIRWCEQRGYSLEAEAHVAPPTAPVPQVVPVRQQQTIVIEAAARSLGYTDPMNIPYGGKGKIRAACTKLTDAQFKRAWQAGVDEGRLRSSGRPA
ncbi:hypothetical protein CCAE64S_02443 [Castellaniella caeni]